MTAFKPQPGDPTFTKREDLNDWAESLVRDTAMTAVNLVEIGALFAAADNLADTAGRVYRAILASTSLPQIPLGRRRRS